ncbi:DNA mismatch repair protein [Ekhidna sp.]|uniref:MutS-related protein n=1 Tax=Ekhidna sp. TaxID=2608089 RepID=UPI00329A77D8
MLSLKQNGKLKVYEEHLESLSNEVDSLKAKDKQMSLIRLVVAFTAGFLFYQFYQTDHFSFAISGVIVTSSFFLLILKHQGIRWRKRLSEEKIKINQDELSFLKNGEFCFENGSEFTKHDHPYSYDLDFFGEKSLFQMLNRTGTVRGKVKLADSLLNIKTKPEIEARQYAIQELNPMIEWRHHLLALGNQEPDNPAIYNRLIEWSNKKPSSLNSVIRILTFLLPLATLIMVTIYFVNGTGGNIAGLLALINLAILGLHFKSLKEELTSTTEIGKILKQYSFLLKSIENQSFKSARLQELQQQLKTNHISASSAIHKLALLFGRLEHVSNIFAAPLLNGLVLYHIHVLHHLSRWRDSYATHIQQWLDTIGQIEQLSSLANFHYNNPSFTFPEINTSAKIDFEDLGHPLIPAEKTVTNSISFEKNRFFILTGSNMSGKSTFLRTVGVNMVLAGIGAPVFARKASVHPLPVLVSMRLSDSLSDSESYFYAEVKRLKYIMDKLDKEPCFVLLDEILRGTNSDDKRNGTIEVIRKMAVKQAFGGIATHDLEVCNISNEFSDVLINKRFEVEIVDDELVFDYKLRDGVCQNKSASFIMRKMNVI